MHDINHQLADLLLDIEAEMRRLALWQDHAPPAEALQSLVPFCHDTLEFEEWLQWVFLPRMKVILEQQQTLPSSSEIHPMAEYRFTQLALDSGPLLTLLGRFDAFIRRHG